MARVKFTTPIGVARFPKLNEPDTKFDKDGVYQVDVVFEPSDLESLRKEIVAFAKEKLPKVTNPDLPIRTKEEKDGGGEITYVRFKSRRRPVILDAKRNKLPEGFNVGGGSRIRVAGTLNAYEKGANKGVNIYLNAVQVIELQQGFNIDDFDDVEDGYVADVNDDVASEFDL